MKNIILTGYDHRARNVGDRNVPGLLSYSARHNVDFHCVRNFDKLTSPRFQRISEILKMFSAGYDRVIWMDCDVIITNMATRPWEFMDVGLTVSRSWRPVGKEGIPLSSFSCGVMVAHKSAGSFLNCAFTSHASNDKTYDIDPAQTLFHLWEEEPTYKPLLTIKETRIMNSAPKFMKRDKLDTWQDKDWVCHLSGVHSSEKVRRINVWQTIQKL